MAELDARRILALRRVEIAWQRNFRMPRAGGIDEIQRGRLRISETGTSGSAATDTNEVLAPFSNSRRTR